MKQVEMYKSENGKFFETEEEAIREELLSGIDEIIAANLFGGTLSCSVRDLAEEVERFCRNSSASENSHLSNK